MPDEQGNGGGDAVPPAGWYPDPESESLIRYWDGKAWTAHTAPRAGAAIEPGAQPAQWTEPQRPLAGIAWAAYAVLAFALLASISYLVAALDYSDVVRIELDVGDVTREQASDAENTLGIASVGYLVAVIAGAVGFLIWWSRAYANIEAITGREPRWSRGWAIGAWFVPIMNLFRPKQMANDVWRAGDPAARDNAGWNSLPVSSVVHWWWAMWLLASLVGGIGGALLSSEPVLSNAVLEGGSLDAQARSDLDQEYAAATVLAASAALEVIAAAVACVFVRHASRRQDELLTEPGSPPAAA